MTNDVNLFKCVRYNKQTALLELLSKKPDITILTRTGHTLLTEAVYRGYYGIVEILVGYKIDLNRKDHKGNTPVMLACFLIY